MKTYFGRFSLAPLILTCAALTLRADLTHRYSFTSNSDDSVGTAHGTLEGAAQVSGGALVLDGSAGTFLNLPGGLVTNYSAVTIETWVTFGTNAAWPRVFDFGGTNPDGNGRRYLFVTQHSGDLDTRLVISDADPGYNHEEGVFKPGTQDNLGKVHIAAVVDPAQRFEGLFINGTLVASRSNLSIPLSQVSGEFSYVGKSLYNADAYLNAQIDEFRIYDRALTRPEVGASYAAGPETPQTDAGALQSIALQLDSSVSLDGFASSTVVGAYAKATNVNLSGLSGLTYETSNDKVITVDTNGTIKGVSAGSATITASYQGKQASKTVQVVQPQAQLKHRYSFTGAAGTTAVDDLVGTADGTLMGAAALTGDGKVTLDGNDAYVDLPNGIISELTNATFEAWVTVNELGTWARIFDFGNNSAGEDAQGTGSTYLFLTPIANNGFVRFASTISSGGGETPVLNGTAPLPVGTEAHVAVAYNASGRVAKLYVNGALVATGTASIALRAIQDINNWLGRSNWPDPFFNGLINEFRIYEGALTDFQVALSAAAGPDKLGGETGTLSGVRILSATNSLVVGALTRLNLVADFSILTNIDVTASPDTTFQSSDPSVLSISNTGLLDARAVGNATITATYQGKQNTSQITVVAAAGAPAKATLAHRYSFGETNGPTVKDSVGSADGTLVGNGTFGSGQLTVPGGGAGSDAGYVDLPNNIISPLTNATFEAWVTWTGNAFWERIFDFGNSTAGEDEVGSGDTYVFLTPLGGPSTLRFAITHTGGGAGEQSLDGPAALTANQETHIAVTYNYLANTARLFVNGQRVGWRPITLALSGLNDVNVWLGRSQWSADPFFTGKYNEFRIYSSALTEAEVAASFAAGPDALPSGEPTGVTLAITNDGNALSIRWPASATGYVLQSSSSLGGQASWTTATETVTVDGSQNKVSIQPSGSAKFYRLSK
ncbi:MAG: LamG-like jellyroll fold domain-containing protein [Verrucomicrobiota bacterium]